VAASGQETRSNTGAGYWDTPGGSVDVYNMYVARSRDGGATWTKPAFATGDTEFPQQLLLGATRATRRLFVTVDPSDGTGTRARRTSAAWCAGSSCLMTVVRLRAAAQAIDSNLYPQAQGEEAGGLRAGGGARCPRLRLRGVGRPRRTCPCGIFETSRDAA